MKKWLFLLVALLAGVYFAKTLITLLAKIPGIGTFFAAKKASDFTA